ncbi:MAG: hypothetical protein IJO02_01640 [Clostridia bacterium]|nr:hypothetical protein [Clostridia bacterium]MBQ6858109.1 hypothetical protein [Clostridia bacterium]
MNQKIGKKTVVLALLVLAAIIAVCALAAGMTKDAETENAVKVENAENVQSAETAQSAADAEENSLQEPVEIMELFGMIVEITEDYVVLETAEHGGVQANLTEDTIVEGVDALEVGQTAIVMYDGKMTRSIPAQITALKIGVYTLRGEVTEIGEGVITVKNADTQEDVILTLPQDAMQVAVGDQIIAYTTGMATMSLPPQMNAIAVEQMEIEEIEAEAADPAENG